MLAAHPGNEMQVQGWEAIPSVEMVGVSGKAGEMARMWREMG